MDCPLVDWTTLSEGARISYEEGEETHRATGDINSINTDRNGKVENAEQPNLENKLKINSSNIVKIYTPSKNSLKKVG